MQGRIVDIVNLLKELEATYVTDTYMDDKWLAIADDMDRVTDRMDVIEKNLVAEVRLLTKRLDTQRNFVNGIMARRILAMVQGGNPTLATSAIQ